MASFMRGIGLSISRLSTARAVLAGAAILAGAALRPVHGQGGGGLAPHSDDLAMAVPRIHPGAGTNGMGLPQPLAPSEAARVRRILALQRQGAIPAAVAETARLNDTTLLGHILADRLLQYPARASAPALSDWLGRYADLPDACAIYALLLRRLPPGATPPAAPAGAALGARTGATTVRENSTGAARDAFLHGHDVLAGRLGRDAFIRSHNTDGQPAFVAGLAAWRLGSMDIAATWFETASLAEGAGAGLRAAAALWAARAHLRQGDVGSWRPWMLRAAAEPHTLHGMLALRALGMQLQASPVSPILGEADIDAIAATPQGRRAFALLQVGEPARAEAELRRLWPVAQTSPGLSRALFLVAGAAGMSDLVSDLSGVVNATEADLPVPILRPRGGYRLDPALVYAVARVESNFDKAAVSGSGAHGLMQLMPVAAVAVGQTAGVDGALADSGQNLRLGQAYLAYLSRHDIAGDDLLRVLASYNSGPGAVQKWVRATDDDPLMFLETIPTDETRHFVQRTLTNLWGYAARFNLAAPSLDALAAGSWPHFATEILPPRPASAASAQASRARLH